MSKNPLEKLKEKLKVKPKVDELKLYEIRLPTKQQEVELKKVKIIDERKKSQQIDMDKLREQLKENRITKVVEKAFPSSSVREKVKSLEKEKETPTPTTKKTIIKPWAVITCK
jgi:hypothetical protein